MRDNNGGRTMKGVAKWIFSIVVIAGALYVYKQYKDIQAGVPAAVRYFVD